MKSADDLPALLSDLVVLGNCSLVSQCYLSLGLRLRVVWYRAVADQEWSMAFGFFQKKTKGSHDLEDQVVALGYSGVFLLLEIRGQG